MRPSISKKLRFDVFKRDGFACQYCGAKPSETVLLEIDHIRPIADGGTNEIDNLVIACYDCNRGKGAAALTSIPQSLEEKAAFTQEREAQLRAYYEILEAAKERKDGELWAVADIFMQRFVDDSILRSRLASIRSFLGRLDFYEVVEAMEIAVDRHSSKDAVFRYFCGICWTRIRNKAGQ